MLSTKGQILSTPPTEPAAVAGITALQLLTHLALADCPAERTAAVAAALPRIASISLHFEEETPKSPKASADLEPLRQLAMVGPLLRAVSLSGHFDTKAAAAMRLPSAVTVCLHVVRMQMWHGQMSVAVQPDQNQSQFGCCLPAV